MPGLPLIAADLGVSASVVNFTVTATLIGLALGKLIGGPLSDRYGRRKIVLIGVVAYVATSIVCAIVPTINSLIAARLAKGVAAGFALIAGQAAGRDIYEGKSLARFFSQIGMAAGITAAIAPSIGAQLLRYFDWRSLFVALAVIAGIILLAVAFAFSETLVPANRTKGGFATTVSQFNALRKDRVFVGAIILAALFSAGLFSYVASAAFVLQGIYGLNPQTFALVVGANAVGMVVFVYLGGRLAAYFGPMLPAIIGVVSVLVAAVILLVGGVSAPLPLPITIAAMFIVTAGTQVTMPAVSTMAVAGYPQAAGTATAVLGVARFAAGAIIAPVVALGGGVSTLMLGITLAVVGILSALAVRALGKATPAHVPA